MDVSIIVVILFSLQTQVYSQILTKSGMSCSGITGFQDGIISQSMLLKKPVKANSLKICRSNWTCCSKQLEDGLYNQSSRVLKDDLRRQVNATRYFFESQGSLFDDFFQNLLKRGKIEWHKMLHKAYKDNYIANSQMFFALFSSLEQYVAEGNVNLTNVTDTFFKELFTKILVLTQSSLKRNQSFLDCASKNIHTIKPFGNTRAVFTYKLTSSLLIARTFTEALKTVSGLITSLIDKLPNSNCVENLTKIRYCSICQGIQKALACKTSCINVFQSCFPSAPDIVTKWNDFVRQLQQLSLVMEGPSSMETVAGQLGYGISSAIMVLHKNFSDVLKKAETVCNVTPGRNKRAVDSDSDLYLEGDSRHKRSGSTLPAHFHSTVRKPTSGPRKSLDSLTSDFRRRLSGVKNVWMDLPKKICSNPSFVVQDQKKSCWNGLKLQSNSQSVPVLKPTPSKTDSKANIQQQLQLLTFLIGKNKEALDSGGVSRDDSDDDDDDDDYGEGSASGSGSGHSASGSGDVSGENRTPVSTNSVWPTSLVMTTPSVSTSPDDDEDSTSSGSGSGDNEISEPTEVTNTDNPNLTDSENEVGTIKTAVVTDPVYGLRNSAKTHFQFSASVTLLCLLISTFF